MTLDVNGYNGKAWAYGYEKIKFDTQEDFRKYVASFRPDEAQPFLTRWEFFPAVMFRTPVAVRNPSGPAWFLNVFLEEAAYLQAVKVGQLS
jgi:hypothetical protein